MKWIKLTYTNGTPVWVNLERFDKMFRSTAEEHPHDAITVLRAVLSAEEEDYSDVDVQETPDEIIGMVT